MKKQSDWDHDRGNSIVGAIFLIVLGSIFLLNTTGVVSWDVWSALLKFWPVFLILVGLQIILGKSLAGSLITGCVSLFIFCFILFLALVNMNSPLLKDLSLPEWLTNIEIDLNTGLGEKKNERFVATQADYGNVEKRDISIEITGGNFSIEETEEENYFTMNADYYENSGIPVLDASQNDDTLNLTFRTDDKSMFHLGDRSGINYDFELGLTEILTDLTLKMTAGKGSVDLDDLNLEDLTVEMTAGDLEVDLDTENLPEVIRIEMTAGDLDLNLPEEVGYKLNYNLTAGSIDTEGQDFSGFVSEGSYDSENYEEAETKVDIIVEMTAGNLKIR